ncbi:unnamed protein product [Calicophoron daubneyi]|uniref:LicD/FKTN/FKRP nucleotidyltransferase domain-containing protein n=1 Tax=Calicophoron daubneyi TaxID=300641 RepID=A0AAV2T605_CALDB
MGFPCTYSRVNLVLISVVISATIPLDRRHSVLSHVNLSNSSVTGASQVQISRTRSRCTSLCEEALQKRRLIFSPLRRDGVLRWHLDCVECYTGIFHRNRTLFRIIVDNLVNGIRNVSAQSGNNTGPTEANVISVCSVATKKNSVNNEELQNCYSILQGYVRIGSMPVELTSSINLDNVYEENNPERPINPIYIHPSTSKHNLTYNKSNFPCPLVSEYRKAKLYRTLQHWIKLANEHQIMWWINYGSLIGSLRDGDIIPYDSDMDICILGSDADKLRKLATDRKDIRINQFNLVTRPADHCPFSTGSRLTCKGRKVNAMVDTCSFCGPLARMFYEYGIYIDVYVTYLQFNNDSRNSPLRFGYFDEGWQEGTYSEEVMSLDHLFPLESCHLMGLIVPCPHRTKVLTEHYGEHFIIPKYLCNVTSSKWVNHTLPHYSLPSAVS